MTAKPKTAILLAMITLATFVFACGGSATPPSEVEIEPSAAPPLPLSTSADPFTLGQQAIDYVNRLADYDVSGSPVFLEVGGGYLIAIAATCDPIDGFKCSRTFFFVDEAFEGFDTFEKYAGEIEVRSGPRSEIEILYTTYTRHDKACCPTITKTVTYSWTGSLVQGSASAPRPFGVVDPVQALAAQTATPEPSTPTATPRPAQPPASGGSGIPIPTATSPAPTPTIAPNAVPSLNSVGFQSSSVTKGGQARLNLTITNTARVNAVIWKQPNGQLTSVALVGVENSGSQYTLTFNLPAGAEAGAWQVAELQVSGGGSVNYTFFAASHYGDFSPCPTFENLGAGFGCTTFIFDSNAKIQVK